jgi:hypothetical protein
MCTSFLTGPHKHLYPLYFDRYSPRKDISHRDLQDDFSHASRDDLYPREIEQTVHFRGVEFEVS